MDLGSTYSTCIVSLMGRNPGRRDVYPHRWKVGDTISNVPPHYLGCTLKFIMEKKKTNQNQNYKVMTIPSIEMLLFVIRRTNIFSFNIKQMCVHKIWLHYENPRFVENWDACREQLQLTAPRPRIRPRSICESSIHLFNVECEHICSPDNKQLHFNRWNGHHL